MSFPANVDLCQVPALRPPDGHTPQFDNPSQSLAPTLVVVSTLMAAWATLFVAGRVYNKGRRIDVADVCAIVGLTFTLALMALLFTTLRYMRHQWDVRACWFNGTYMKINFVVQLIMLPAFFFSKTAILLLLREIFGVNRRMRIAIWIGIVACAVVYFQNFILVPIFSVPYAGQTWEDMVTSPRTFKMMPVGTEQGTLAVVLDIYIFLLPMPMLASLNLKSSKRLKLLGIFGTALIGVVASIIGLAFRVRLLSVEDHTWANAQLYPLIFVELFVAVIVSCMPSFAQLLLVSIPQSALFQSISSRLLRSQYHSGANKSDAEIPKYSSSAPSSWRPSWRRRNWRDTESSEENLAGCHAEQPHDIESHCHELKPVGGMHDSVDGPAIAQSRRYHVGNKYDQKTQEEKA